MSRRRKGDKSPNALGWCKKHGACSDAIAWIFRNNIQTMNEVWHRCGRSDWLQWVINRELDNWGPHWDSFDTWYYEFTVDEKRSPSIAEICIALRRYFSPVGYDPSMFK